MKLIIYCFFISILLLSPILSIESNDVQSQQYYEDATIDEFSNSQLNETESQPSNMLRGSDRFLLPKRRVRLTCNKVPRLCHAKGSLGTHCCKKKCVIVFTESQPSNIASTINEICRKGKCVNPSFHRRLCGGCNSRCKDGGFH
ncbi:hypothetical protein D8674_022199 [Pyrus ussuriensis x Pyrus communis]|uniref:Stigma-specific STIG1-like protein 1 n=1 Tax=Pyrus ussuriensis x Pyrus communis TaxID=2448454 RepID=A0A5N5GP23_9ROSA|nr:hypothetical protein D8674_022199 [Pyrus ussuriensis x Pyrus communis]